jgi:hypothetical protein
MFRPTGWLDGGDLMEMLWMVRGMGITKLLMVIFSWQLKLDEVLYFSTVCFLGELNIFVIRFQKCNKNTK